MPPCGAARSPATLAALLTAVALSSCSPSARPVHAPIHTRIRTDPCDEGISSRGTASGANRSGRAGGRRAIRRSRCPPEKGLCRKPPSRRPLGQ